MLNGQAVYEWGISLVEKIDFSYVVLFMIAAVTYYLIRPVIIWLITSQAIRLLNYVMTSFIILLFLMGGIALTAIFQLQLLEAALHSLAAFGGCLVIAHLLKFVFQKKIKRA
ncbi:hypothetical protein [Lentibacillus amyloliquefaciens]|uniref:Uncharacterized protein n=1 Tax=Lentibacillus amyloliquefaciens TaxID=1472767 RepID=A0A0U4F158_9BACI|nr:hypothetical protein [Lentibacillus amyloliquefaciens]ALX47318.1 hypothetical protein AOX59_01110 [Lentibacillus amyloliquefaciens]